MRRETAVAIWDLSLLVIDKGIHEQPLIDELLPLWFLICQVSVVIVGDDDAVGLVRQLHNEAVIIANHTTALDTPRWGEHQNLLLLQATQDLLICVSGVELITKNFIVVEQFISPHLFCYIDLLSGRQGATALSSMLAQTP